MKKPEIVWVCKECGERYQKSVIDSGHSNFGVDCNGKLDAFIRLEDIKSMIRAEIETYSKNDPSWHGLDTFLINLTNISEGDDNA